MKKLYVLNFITITLCIVGTAIFLIFSPEIIPVHYNFAGEVDRFGSKYENLIFPCITTLTATCFLLAAKQMRKRDEAAGERILLYTGVMTSLFFTAIGFYFMLKVIKYDPDAVVSSSIDIVKFVSIAMGLLLIVLGNIMPKMRRNSLFGLRTKWSMANDYVWRKSQRFGGIASVICGLLMVIMAAFIPGVWNILFMTVIIIVWVIVSIIASYRYYQADIADKQE